VVVISGQCEVNGVDKGEWIVDSILHSTTGGELHGTVNRESNEIARSGRRPCIECLFQFKN
jgi:hypothetical protein